MKNYFFGKIIHVNQVEIASLAIFNPQRGIPWQSSDKEKSKRVIVAFMRMRICELYPL